MPAQPQSAAPGLPAAATTSYTPFPFEVPSVSLDISISPGTTRVTSEVRYMPLQQQQEPVASGAAAAGPAAHQQLVLDGEDLELLQLSLDGRALQAGTDYTWDEEEGELVVLQVPTTTAFTLTAVTAIHPEEHATDLEGMFFIGGVYTTQCEAMQFSMMTVFPDRPDILSRWRVRLEADAASCPVLLSNGDMVEAGALPDGRHFAVWEDPWPKPCYLMSLVAGDLVLRTSSYTSRLSGRQIALHLYVPQEYAEQLQVATTSIKAAMAWDEAAFGREYDLDTYTMVGLEGFNDDATETKGMSLFSINVLAACPAANTDDEVDTVRRLVAHEYFHNWSGNRITLRDWCNLTVKEGLTVYREQQFLADYDAAAAATTAPPGSAAWEQQLLDALFAHASASAAEGVGACAEQPQAASWKRVMDAADLREDQVPEDEGPLAHPIRPAAVASLSNLYTDTVYSKGAAVVRMFKFLLGPAAFKRGVEAFFDSNDGKAVVCEDFVEALAAANPDTADLVAGMQAWYRTPGTPTLSISSSYSPASQSLTLTVRQSNETAAEQDASFNQPVLIPLKVGLVGPDGRDMPLRLKAGGAGGKHKAGSKGGSKHSSSSSTAPSMGPDGVVFNTGLDGQVSTSVVLLVDAWTKSFTFTQLPERPVVSLLRDFSAPVRLEVEGETDKPLGFLAQHDSNPFARWDAMQRLLTRLLTRLYDKAEEAADGIDSLESLSALLVGACGGPPPALLAALQAVLNADGLDGEFRASMLQLPSVMEVAAELDEPDPELLWMVWVHVGQQLAASLAPQLQALIERCDAQLAGLPPGFEGPGVKLRALRNAALGMISFDWSEQRQQDALARYHGASCMTDRLAALELLADEDSAARQEALDHFAATYQDQPLAMLKWLYVQAACDLEDNAARIARLLESPRVDIANPATAEEIYFGFAESVPNFHAEDGSGYAFLADGILRVDALNSQTAARLAAELSDYEDWDADRQALMLAQLRRLAAADISDDLREIVEKSLPDS